MKTITGIVGIKLRIENSMCGLITQIARKMKDDFVDEHYSIDHLPNPKFHCFDIRCIKDEFLFIIDHLGFLLINHRKSLLESMDHKWLVFAFLLYYCHGLIRSVQSNQRSIKKKNFTSIPLHQLLHDFDRIQENVDVVQFLTFESFLEKRSSIENTSHDTTNHTSLRFVPKPFYVVDYRTFHHRSTDWLELILYNEDKLFVYILPQVLEIVVDERWVSNLRLPKLYSTKNNQLTKENQSNGRCSYAIILT